MPSLSNDSPSIAEVAMAAHEPAHEVVILGTGGTIAGRAATSGDNLGYVAGADRVEDLVAAVPALAGQPLHIERIAQIDSKDMDVVTWQALAQRCLHHLARPQVAGIVVTHGTDTLEETAWFLHRVLAPAKPVVLTAAMRPASSLQADGPQNLLDAVGLARWPGAQGVMVAFAGRVHGARDVQKIDSYRIDAFASPNEGVVAVIEEARVRPLRPWPTAPAVVPPAAWSIAPSHWPFVAIVTSHAGADAREVLALVEAGVRGLVVAGTGNATVHRELEAALNQAMDRGVQVRRCSRCANGVVLAGPAAPSTAPPFYPGLQAAKSRIELQLELLAAGT